MNAVNPSENRSRKRQLQWYQYLLTAFIAYLLPLLAVLLEMVLDWQNQVHLVTHFGLPFAKSGFWIWMIIPASISFVILFLFARSTRGGVIASACICLCWMLFLMANRAAV